jgi:hypothetical protein
MALGDPASQNSIWAREMDWQSPDDLTVPRKK